MNLESEEYSFFSRRVMIVLLSLSTLDNSVTPEWIAESFLFVCSLLLAVVLLECTRDWSWEQLVKNIKNATVKK